MKANNNQSAIQAMDIYKRAQQRGQDVMVSGKGEIREITLFDRFKENMRSLNPNHIVKNWESESREHIKTRFIQDIQLFKPDLSPAEKGDLDKMTAKILDLSKQSSRYWSALLTTESSENPRLFDVITNIKSMHEKVNPRTYSFVRTLLQNNHGNLDEAIIVANLALQLKQEKGLATDVAMNAAKNIHFAMQTFTLDFKDAFDLVLFSGRLVHTGKLSQSKESIENAYIIKSLTKKCNVSQEYALEQRSNVMAVMRRDKISIKEAVNIIARRIAVLPEINSGLPKNMAISPADEIATISQKLPNDFQQKVIDDFKKLSAKKDESPATSDPQFELDVQRIVVSIKPVSKAQTNTMQLESLSMAPDLKSRSSEAVNTDLKAFAANDVNLAGMLTRMLNQKALAGLAVNAWQSTPVAGGDIMNAPAFSIAEKNVIRFQTSIFELSAEDKDNIFLECTYLQKSHLLFDANGKSWKVNRGRDWEGDVSDRNCGQRLKLKLKFSRAELRSGISNPQIVQAATIECFIKPAWDIIDAELAASAAASTAN